MAVDIACDVVVKCGVSESTAEVRLRFLFFLVSVLVSAGVVAGGCWAIAYYVHAYVPPDKNARALSTAALVVCWLCVCRVFVEGLSKGPRRGVDR